jgi:hypothetical protein
MVLNETAKVIEPLTLSLEFNVLPLHAAHPSTSESISQQDGKQKPNN